MKLPQRVVWSEGLLMSPQHLQQLDAYHEQFVAARLAAVVPYPWGVFEVVLDPGMLQRGQLLVSRFSGILPDGTPLSFNAGDPGAPAARAIEGHFSAKQTALEVFLCMPKERVGAPNYGEPQTGRGRFRAVPRPVTDIGVPDSELSVAFAQPNLAVLFGDEPLLDQDAIKIAEVVRDDTGALIPMERYIPPCVRIGASPFIIESLKELMVRMASKQRQLADERRQRDGASVEFTATDVTRYLQLNALNTSIPVLGHMAEAGDVSPLDAYLYLLQVAGGLSTFSTDDITRFPSFVFTNLRETFEALFARLMSLLRATVREAHLTVPLEVRHGMHVGKLEDERVLRSTQLVLLVRSEMPDVQVAQMLPGLSKIASWEQINGLVRAAASGVPLQVTHRPPPEIPIRNGVTYFMLNLQNAYWQSILRERTVAVYLPPPFEPPRTRLELLAVPRAT